MENQIYSTAQVGEILGVSGSTVRTWKQRKPDILREGQHWFTQDNAVFWTQQGLNELTAIKAGATVSVSEGETASVSDLRQSASQAAETPTTGLSHLLARYEPLVEMLADALSQPLQQQLDRKIQQNLVTSDIQPMTTIECVAVLSSLGIKPCDPAALLNGNYTAGLLAGSDDDEPTSNNQ